MPLKRIEVRHPDGNISVLYGNSVHSGLGYGLVIRAVTLNRVREFPPEEVVSYSISDAVGRFRATANGREV